MLCRKLLLPWRIWTSASIWRYAINIDSELNRKIDRFIKRHTTHIIRDISELIKIKSVAEDDSQIKPYGRGCRDVLDTALEISRRLGFETDNCDYYCGSASLKNNDSGKHIAFWNHLDVVPEGAGWTYPPFDPALHEGYIVGRGSSDNKGPSICSLYTLLFFQENDYNLKYNYKVIFGTNEERGMDDVDYYLQHRPLPVFSIIADSVFPICYAEKGIFRAEIKIPLACDNLIAMTGGSVSNAVAARAEARLLKTDDMMIPKAPEEITVEDCGDTLVVHAQGIAAHASSPEGSKNAIHLLAAFLVHMQKDDNLKDALKFISHITGSHDGSSLGIQCSDAATGSLTCVAGVMNYYEDSITLSLDIRYPVTADIEQLVQKIESICADAGAELVNTRDSSPCYVDPADELVLVLNDFYNDYMGTDIPPYYEGGGSYARKVPNSLAYGPILHQRKPKPDSLSHGGAHKPDESLCIDEILEALKIYILTILKMDRMEF